jgi:hypothetical protein
MRDSASYRKLLSLLPCLGKLDCRLHEARLHLIGLHLDSADIDNEVGKVNAVVASLIRRR